MDNPADILEPMLAEAGRTLMEMEETEDLASRRIQSEIVQNLCQAAGVFFELMSNTMMPEEFPFPDLPDDADDADDDEA